MTTNKSASGRSRLLSLLLAVLAAVALYHIQHERVFSYEITQAIKYIASASFVFFLFGAVFAKQTSGTVAWMTLVSISAVQISQTASAQANNVTMDMTLFALLMLTISLLCYGVGIFSSWLIEVLARRMIGLL
jgi:flagellar biosynthesis protein FlhB